MWSTKRTGPARGRSVCSRRFRSTSGSGAQVEALEAEQVEDVERRRQLERRALDVGGAALLRPPLQALEARAALLVEHDDLAVEHEVAEGQRRERPGDLGVDRRGVAALAVDEAGGAALALGEHPEAVVLQLEEPGRVAERLLAPSRPASA